MVFAGNEVAYDWKGSSCVKKFGEKIASFCFKVSSFETWSKNQQKVKQRNTPYLVAVFLHRQCWLLLKANLLWNTVSNLEWTYKPLKKMLIFWKRMPSNPLKNMCFWESVTQEPFNSSRTGRTGLCSQFCIIRLNKAQFIAKNSLTRFRYKSDFSFALWKSRTIDWMGWEP